MPSRGPTRRIAAAPVSPLFADRRREELDRVGRRRQRRGRPRVRGARRERRGVAVATAYSAEIRYR